MALFSTITIVSIIGHDLESIIVAHTYVTLSNMEMTLKSKN